MSRYPSIGYSGTLYDRSLLAAAPQVTRQDRQAGYDIDILEQGRASYNANANNARNSTFSNFERGFKPVPPINLNDPDEKKYAPLVPDSPPSQTSPEPILNDYTPYNGNPRSRKARFIAFCKSKKGIRILILLAIVLVGLLCGIGAGVATARKQVQERQNNNNGNGAENSNNGGGLNGAASGSGTDSTSSTTRTRPVPGSTSSTRIATDTVGIVPPSQPSNTATTSITFGGDIPVTRTITAGLPPTQSPSPPPPQPFPPQDPPEEDLLPEPFPPEDPSNDDEEDEPWFCSISNLIPGCKIPA